MILGWGDLGTRYLCDDALMSMLATNQNMEANLFRGNVETIFRDNYDATDLFFYAFYASVAGYRMLVVVKMVTGD